MLLWYCGVYGVKDQNNDECQKAAKKSLSNYANDEQNAVYCVRFLVFDHHFIRDFVYDLAER